MNKDVLLNENYLNEEKKCQQRELEILLSREDWISAYFVENDGLRTCIMVRRENHIFLEARDGNNLWLEARIPSGTTFDYEFIRHFDPIKGVIKDLLTSRSEYNEKHLKRECGSKFLHFLFGLKIKGIVPKK